MQAAFVATVLKQIATEIGNIKAEYRGVVSEESIDLLADQSLQNLAGSKVPRFVPLFVGRFTRDRLRELTGFRPRVGFTQLWAGELYGHQRSADVNGSSQNSVT